MTVLVRWVTPILMLLTGFAHAHSMGSDSTSRAEPYLEQRGDSLQAIEKLLQRYSRDGDDALLSLARARLGRFESSPPQLRYSLLAARLAQAEHRFQDAIDHMDVALELAPRNGAAWLYVANLRRIVGDLEGAGAACRATAGRMPFSVTIACGAQVRLARNDSTLVAQQALDRLGPIVEREAGALPTAIRAWLRGVQGDLFMRTSSYADAQESFRESLALVPGVQMRAALAQSLTMDGKAAAALELLDPQTSVPALLMARLLALKSLRQLDEQRELVDRLDTHFRHAIGHGDLQHSREMALFYFDILPDVALASRLAKANWRTQREWEDARLFARAMEREAPLARGL